MSKQWLSHGDKLENFIIGIDLVKDAVLVPSHPISGYLFVCARVRPNACSKDDHRGRRERRTNSPRVMSSTGCEPVSDEDTSPMPSPR